MFTAYSGASHITSLLDDDQAYRSPSLPNKSKKCGKSGLVPLRWVQAVLSGSLPRTTKGWFCVFPAGLSLFIMACTPCPFLLLAFLVAVLFVFFCFVSLVCLPEPSSNFQQTLHEQDSDTLTVPTASLRLSLMDPEALPLWCEMS